MAEYRAEDFFGMMEETLEDSSNLVETENGAVALVSTKNACLDAFGSLGAMMHSDEDTIINTFEKAYNEDKTLATKMLFYMRDIRGGQGQRRVFRTILKWMANNHPEAVKDNFANVLFYGRGDDLLCLLDTDVVRDVCAFVRETLESDYAHMRAGREVTLLAKWLPSENASSKETKRYAKIIRDTCKWTPKQYRVILSDLRKYLDVVERRMSANKWATINYEKVPSKAAMNYTNAFFTHDEDGYTRYLKRVAEGDAKVNAGALFPVDIIHKILAERYSKFSKVHEVVNNAMWEALPTYFGDKEETGICVVDTSGSMMGQPYEVAVSLGLYCADKCRGPFAGKFITFAERPTLETPKGNTITEKVNSLKCINAGNTDFEAVFDLILTTGIKNHVADKDMPKKLYVISDMQFDRARGGYLYSWHTGEVCKARPFMQLMRNRYESAGYTMPTIVYWNVRASECGMFQQTFEGENCAMVSGYSPSLFKAVIEGTEYETAVDDNGNEVVHAKVDPMNVMLTTLDNERYDRVVVW